MACIRCEYEYGPIGIVGYLYQSVKDSLKDVGLSVKKHRRTVMAIGKLVSLNNEDYRKVLYSSSKTSVSSMTADEINRLAGVENG